jgi:hypothetical protein
MQTWQEFAAEQNARLGIRHIPAGVVSRPLQPRGEAAAPPVALTHPETRIRHAAGQMNGMEKRYAAHLDLRLAVKEISAWKFEPLKLKLAPATFWTPDFEVVMPDGGIELHETKGHWEDDARVKIKIAAQAFREFLIVAVTWDKRNKIWRFEEFR